MLQCGTGDDKQLKIELLNQLKLEAEFRNNQQVIQLNNKHASFILNYKHGS